MKLTNIQIERLVRRVFDEMKKNKIIEFKEDEGRVFRRALEIVQANVREEAELDREVTRMMDDLEKKSPGEFSRYKMFPLLKKRLAKEKGIIL